MAVNVYPKLIYTGLTEGTDAQMLGGRLAYLARLRLLPRAYSSWHNIASAFS